MKNILVLSFLLLAGVIGQSQIEINSADMPQTNVPYPRSSANATSAFDLSTGSDYLWDYSFLESIGYDTIIYVPVNNAPFIYQLLFNNVFVQEYYADHARHTADFSIPGIAEFTDNYEFYQNNTEDYRKLGQGSNISGFPTVSQNNPIDIMYRFPMQFGNVDSSYTELDMNVPGFLFFHQEINRFNEVDGWGTLQLPLESYDVLRMRTTLYEVDSIHLENPLPFGINIPLPDVVEYKWFALGEGVPVLTITETAGLVSSVSYKDSIPPAPVDTTANAIVETDFYDLNVFPNPIAEEVTLTGIDYQNTKYIRIFNLQGEIIYSSDDTFSNVLIIDTSKFASGQYILELGNEKFFERRKLIKIE